MAHHVFDVFVLVLSHRRRGCHFRRRPSRRPAPSGEFRAVPESLVTGFMGAPSVGIAGARNERKWPRFFLISYMFSALY